MNEAQYRSAVPELYSVTSSVDEGWSTSQGKRLLDIALALFGLLVSAPVLIVSAILIKLTSPGPVLFRQKRSGKNGDIFEIFKLRTMRQAGAGSRLTVTSAADNRITAVGRILRHYKLDELPQLFNVLLGDMSFVGPRPFVAEQNPAIFPCRPGLTGAGSLAFRHQEHLLRLVHPQHLVRVHDQILIRRRGEVDRVYMNRATLWSDIDVMAQTFLAVAGLLRHTSYDIDLRSLIAPWLSNAAQAAATQPVMSLPTRGTDVLSAAAPRSRAAGA